MKDVVLIMRVVVSWYGVDYAGIVSNSSPVVELGADVTSGSLPLTVNFTSVGTFDPDGDPLTYQWDFDGNGTIDSNQENPSFNFTHTRRIQCVAESQ